MGRYAIKAVLLAGLCLAPVAASAQSAVEGRVDRLESEMRAVQRKVFPGGSGQYVVPENAPADGAAPLPGSPSSSPVTDLNARVNALESQMNGLTSQIETTTHKLQLLEDAFNAYKRSSDARLKALEDTASSTTGATAAEPPIARPAPIKPPPVAAAKPTTPVPGKPAATPSRDPARAAKVAAIERSVSGDAGEDAYLYGYRLWQAKLYPEAETQLKSVVATYPQHKRASYAQNLLGRAYLDDGTATGDRATLKTAANTFLDNYKKMPNGDRAPESLYFLGQSLTRLDAAGGACKAYDEVTRVYGDKVAVDLKAKIAAGRVEAKCK